MRYSNLGVCSKEIKKNEAKASIQELSMNRFELFASKLKADDWNWFDENYPRKGNNFLGKIKEML